MTIRMRLTLTYTMILTVTLSLFGWALYALHGKQMRAEADEQLEIRAKEVIAHMEIVEGFPLGIGKYVEIPPFDIFARADLFVQVLNESGKVLSRSDNLGGQLLPISQRDLERTLQIGFELKTYTVNGYPIRMYVAPFYYGNRLLGFVQIATPLETMTSSLHTLKWVLVSLGGLTILLATGVGWWLARSALKPVDQIITATEAIQEGRDLQKRIKVIQERDEIGRLAKTINEMLQRLHTAYERMEQSIQVQRRFVSDASHELRSPLTSIRGNVDWLLKAGEQNGLSSVDELQNRIRLYREAWKDIQEEATRMSTMVDELLALARSDSKAPVAKKEIPILPWLDRNIRLFANRTSDAIRFDSHISNRISDRQLLWGNEELLDRLLHVLIDNAFKYTAEGTITLASDIDIDGKSLILSIQDTGEGIAKKDLPHIFERFYRGDPARDRTGTGLGLSIAAAITEEHGGRITVSSHVGEGSEFQVFLPLLEASAG
jgi:two-component system OmpR family sensor kinase